MNTLNVLGGKHIFSALGGQFTFVHWLIFYLYIFAIQLDQFDWRERETEKRGGTPL